MVHSSERSRARTEERRCEMSAGCASADKSHPPNLCSSFDPAPCMPAAPFFALLSGSPTRSNSILKVTSRDTRYMLPTYRSVMITVSFQSVSIIVSVACPAVWAHCAEETSTCRLATRPSTRRRSLVRESGAFLLARYQDPPPRRPRPIKVPLLWNPTRESANGGPRCDGECERSCGREWSSRIITRCERGGLRECDRVRVKQLHRQQQRVEQPREQLHQHVDQRQSRQVYGQRCRSIPAWPIPTACRRCPRKSTCRVATAAAAAAPTGDTGVRGWCGPPLHHPLLPWRNVSWPRFDFCWRHKRLDFYNRSNRQFAAGAAPSRGFLLELLWQCSAYRPLCACSPSSWWSKAELRLIIDIASSTGRRSPHSHRCRLQLAEAVFCIESALFPQPRHRANGPVVLLHAVDRAERGSSSRRAPRPSCRPCHRASLRQWTSC